MLVGLFLVEVALSQPAWLDVTLGSETVKLPYDRCGGLAGRRRAVDDFMSLQPVSLGTGCDTATCVRERLVEAMEDRCELAENAYLELLLASLTGKLQTTRFTQTVDKALGYDLTAWPSLAATMVDEPALRSLRWMIETAPGGDVVEAGVWRGGAAIFARATMKTGTMFVLDSFKGLPQSSTSHDIDWWARQAALRVSEAEVRELFERYLPKARFSCEEKQEPAVCFVPGFVRDTAANIPATDISVLRIDVDMYEGYLDLLFALGPRVREGGFFIMDDYGAVPEAQKAVTDFRSWFNITSPLYFVGKSAAWWRATERLQPKNIDDYLIDREPPNAPRRWNVGGLVDVTLPSNGTLSDAVAVACLRPELLTSFGDQCHATLQAAITNDIERDHLSLK